METELRFKVDQQAIAHLALANGHFIGKECTMTDIARASIHTCCYVWMIAHPDFKGVPGFHEECKAQAHWLFEPETYRLLTAGARNANFLDPNTPEVRNFQANLMKSFTARESQSMKLQVHLPYGLWRRVKAAFGFRHGATNEAFANLMAALLRHAEALELPGEETSDV